MAGWPRKMELCRKGLREFGETPSMEKTPTSADFSVRIRAQFVYILLSILFLSGKSVSDPSSRPIDNKKSCKDGRSAGLRR
jgi:hypothetical protein